MTAVDPAGRRLVAVWSSGGAKDPHPATHAAVALASDLYRQRDV
jgi:hypothetical protein